MNQNDVRALFVAGLESSTELTPTSPTTQKCGADLQSAA